ncbi:MAG: MgtC/SapB family protein, partial [Clostridia bacterium]|nr:MgtC/SapB family protein [Clostridia bacterium]
MAREAVFQFRVLFDLILAAILGFSIGFERKLRAKEAGIGTHTIVSVGSALYMVVSKYAFSSDADSARVAAQIVTGIGFLGAGIIVNRKHEVRGLTTAAGVWSTAAVGMACGGQQYLLAIGATILIVGCQFLFHKRWRVFQQKRYYSINIVFRQTFDERERIKAIFDIDRYNRLVLTREGDSLIYHATLNTDIEYSSAQL